MICVELAAVLQTVGALREARDGEGFVLLAASVIDGMLRVFGADEISLNDRHAYTNHSITLELWPTQVAGEPRGASCGQLWDMLAHSDGQRAARYSSAVMVTGDLFSDHQCDSTIRRTDDIELSGLGHALAMPLPAPPEITRRLAFSRRCPFGEEDRSAAVLLQPHIAEALRCQGRHAAARLLTGRQRELLRLVAAGHDNIAIARQLGLSPGTVRKHLENTFARLDVSTRTAAVAKVCPDATWLGLQGSSALIAVKPLPMSRRRRRPTLILIHRQAAGPRGCPRNEGG